MHRCAKKRVIVGYLLAGSHEQCEMCTQGEESGSGSLRIRMSDKLVSLGAMVRTVAHITSEGVVENRIVARERLLGVEMRNATTTFWR